MAAPAKFLFDSDFSAAGRAKDAQPVFSKAAYEAAIAEAEMRGYRNGMTAAEAQARTEAERRTAAAFENIGATVALLQQSLAAVEARFEAESVDVAVAVASRLAPALIAQEPLTEIKALADSCFRELLTAPHVVVRVSEALYAQAREKLEDIARARGFEGRLVVMGEADIATGDCRIEWADGGLLRDRAATENAIADAVQRYVAVRRNGAGT